VLQFQEKRRALGLANREVASGGVLFRKEEVMNTFVVYDSQFGNTERIAQVIADTLQAFGPVRVMRVDPDHPFDCQEADVLLLGSPTQAFRPTPAMQSLVGNVPFVVLHDLAVACFDTRVHGPWGSAARHMARRLRMLGVHPLVSPMSFFVQGTEGPLAEGEVERAARWAVSIRQQYEASQQHLVAH
jgi:flavodoxin